jgi:hypothetical protein
MIRGRDIEVLTYTPEELKRIAHRKFIQTIFQEGKIIYERKNSSSKTSGAS